MAWKDVKARILGFFGGSGGSPTRRPDGGTSCYRPIQRRDRREENLAREKAAEYAASQPQVASLHTGFTGMNPPTGGNAPVQSTLTGSPWGPAYDERTGYAPQGDPRGYGPGGGEPGREADNISYMPGAYSPDAGSSYTHVEHIMAITSLQSCYDAIECMKNGETLIVTLDVLSSEGESLRCQDMLAGAAFTLQCTVRKLAGAGVIVIAPAGVKILPEQRYRRAADPGEYEAAPGGWAREEYTPRRERRSSQNPVGWENAARGGSQGYNPYTGSMPAVAGEYSSFGGY